MIHMTLYSDYWYIQSSRGREDRYYSPLYWFLYGKEKEIIFDVSFSYISSLLFLSIIGSVLAFTLYLKLVEKIGAGRAGYIGAILPVVALVISTYFENLVWNQNFIIGLPLLIIGAVLVVNQKQ